MYACVCVECVAYKVKTEDKEFKDEFKHSRSSIPLRLPYSTVKQERTKRSTVDMITHTRKKKKNSLYLTEMHLSYTHLVP